MYQGISPVKSYRIGEGVKLGRDVRINEYASLSHCSIGDECLIGPYVEVHNGVVIGDRVRLFRFINLYGCRIGNDTKVGAFVEMQKGVAVGARCKVSSHSFLCEGVTLEDEVFIGHGVKFTNDRFPRATRCDGKLKADEDWEVIHTSVLHRASIGSGAVIMCGISIGAGAIVGAGAVVTRDVPSGQIWAGNPARYLRDVNPEEE